MNYLTNFINYLQTTKNLSEKTFKAYSCDLKQFFVFEKNILHPDICAFISYLNKQLRLKDTSIRRKIITLKNFYNYLLEFEIIDSSPFKKLKFRFKQERKLPKTLTIIEISKILKCFDVDLATLSSFVQKEYIRDAALLDLLSA